MLDFLISHGADITAKDISGKTVLFYIIDKDYKRKIYKNISFGKLDRILPEDDRIKALNILISHGADINAKDGFGNKPINFAMKKNNKEMIDLLTVKYWLE